MSEIKPPPIWGRLMTDKQQLQHVLKSLRRLEHICEQNGIDLNDSEWEWVYQMTVCKRCEKEYYDIENIVFCDEITCGTCPICCKCASE